MNLINRIEPGLLRTHDALSRPEERDRRRRERRRERKEQDADEPTQADRDEDHVLDLVA